MQKKKLSFTANILIFFFFFLIFGFISVYQGIAIDFDFLNYHLYIPFAFLTGRINTDIAPCGIHSFLNPILDIPYFLMFKNWLNTPYLICFCQGIYCAILAFLVFQINIFFLQKTPLKGLFYPFIATVLGISDCILISIFNSTFNDTQIAILNLLAFLLLTKNLIVKNTLKRTLYIILSAFLAGVSFGLKFNFYIFTLFLIILFFHKILKKKNLFLKTIITFSIFSIIGFLISDGYFIFLFLKKMNELSFLDINNLTSGNLFLYLSKIVREGLEPKWYKFFYINPFVWSIKSFLVEGMPFFDFKHILAFLSFGWMCIWFTTDKAKSNLKLNYRLKALLLFIFISYILWSNSICVLRYLLSTLVLSGTIIVLASYSIFTYVNINNVYEKKMFTVIILFFSFFNYSPLLNEKTHEKIIIPKLNLAENSLVILLSNTLSYLAVENPNAEYTYIREEFFSLDNYTKYIEKEIRNKENIYIIGQLDDFGMKKQLENTFKIKLVKYEKINSLTQDKDTVDWHTKNVYICKAEK